MLFLYWRTCWTIFLNRFTLKILHRILFFGTSLLKKKNKKEKTNCTKPSLTKKKMTWRHKLLLFLLVVVVVVVAARCLQFILVVTGFSCLRALRNVFIHWRQNVLSFECLLLLLLLIKCKYERVWVCVCGSVWMCVYVYGDVVCLRECATCRWWWLIIWLHYGRNRCSERWVVAVVIAAPARPSTTILSGLPVLLYFDLPFF